MNSFSSLLSLMLKFRRLGLNLLCSSCVHSIPPCRQDKWDFYSFRSSLWVRAGCCWWGWCDRSNSGLSTPRFPAAAPDVPFLCLSVPCQTPWGGGRALRESPGEEQECCSCSPAHVEGAGTAPEMRCEENRAPLERTLRKLATARVTGSVVTERRAAPQLHAKANPWKMGWELPRYTHYQHWKIFLLLFSGVSYCSSKGSME